MNMRRRRCFQKGQPLLQQARSSAALSLKVCFSQVWSFEIKRRQKQKCSGGETQLAGIVESGVRRRQQTKQVQLLELARPVAAEPTFMFNCHPSSFMRFRIESFHLIEQDTDATDHNGIDPFGRTGATGARG